MKLFTVKDFITYNNPCFSCGEKIVFTFNDINPVIDGAYCNVNLIIAYSSKTSLFLKIDLKTNKFQTDNIKGLKRYLENTSPLVMNSVCTKCKTEIRSDYLVFDLDKQIIRPCKNESEYLIVNEGKLKYLLYTSAYKSVLRIKENPSQQNILYLEVDKGGMFLSKIKTREKLIQKLRTYLIFS